MEPSVVTSELYNQARNVFVSLQNKESLISFLDCAIVLRSMGMNPTHVDLDKLKNRMSQPIVRLEQWRREEELKREKERSKEEMRLRKGNVKIKLSGDRRNKGGSTERRKTVLEKVIEEGEKPVKIVPEEEIKNIDWNIFITCAKSIFRDSAEEEKLILHALLHYHKNNSDTLLAEEANDTNANVEKLYNTANNITMDSNMQSSECNKIINGIKSIEDLIKVVTSNGENVLTPAEVKLARKLLSSEWQDDHELAARLQGTYRPITAEEELERSEVTTAISDAQRRWRGDDKRDDINNSYDNNDNSSLLASIHV